MAEPGIQQYEFGPYRIDTEERLLHRGSELISLPPKAVETLLALLGAAGRMVDKGDLMKAVWPDTFVEEGALTRNISLLRKALGDTGEEAAYIETIPKRGYRFVAPLQPGGSEPGPSDLPEAPALASPLEELPPSVKTSWRAKIAAPAGVLLLAAVVALANYWMRRDQPAPVVSAKAPANALAVLPFRNVESDPAEDYFADGMTQALITGLAKLGNLRVISLAPAAGGPREPAALDAVVRDRLVNHVLTGTVLRAGGRVRIDAQLTDPKTHAVTWANYYERDLKDLLALEATVAEAIASEIQVTITAQEKQRLEPARQIRPEALDAYLRGRYLWNRRTEEALNRAVQYFQQAIAADPTYAPAYSGLADSYSLLGSIGIDGMPPNKAMPLAKAAALKALELDPRGAEAHVSLAYVKLSYDWDLRGAAEEFERATALAPASPTLHHWYSHYFMAAGDLPKATEQMQAAVRLEPLSPSINIGIGWCYYYSRQYDKAIEQYRSVVEMDPSFPMAHQTLAMAYQQIGKYPEAIEEFQRAVSLSGSSPTAVAGLGSAYAAAGKLEQAREQMSRLEEMSKQRYVPAFYFATIHHALGDTSKTLDWAWKAVGERSDYLIYLHVEPRVGKLAGNPEFIKMLGRLH
jgi:DNA-binding winged helix-turn-helix (wHTH) protein/TolB-like protein/Tfp pilus assembly protein PilF